MEHGVWTLNTTTFQPRRMAACVKDVPGRSLASHMRPWSMSKMGASSSLCEAPDSGTSGSFSAHDRNKIWSSQRTGYLFHHKANLARAQSITHEKVQYLKGRVECPGWRNYQFFCDSDGHVDGFVSVPSSVNTLLGACVILGKQSSNTISRQLR